MQPSGEKVPLMARICYHAGLVGLGLAALGLAGLVAGCGSTAPRDSSCGNPAYTFTLAGGRQVFAGDCPGYVFGPPSAVTVRRGETFTVTPGDAASSYLLPVPQPTGPAVVVVSTHRNPHAGTRATYRAAQPGSVLLMVYHQTFCWPPMPQLGEPLSRYRRQSQAVKQVFLSRYRRARRAWNREVAQQKPRNCPALAVRVIG